MNNELRKSIVAYLRDEFGETIKDANEDASHTIVGMAYTQLQDTDLNEHDLEVDLLVPLNAISYNIDGEEITRVTAPSLVELAAEIDRHSFDDWIYDCKTYSDYEWYEDATM